MVEKVDEGFLDQFDENGNYRCLVCGYSTEESNVSDAVLTANLGGLIIMICPNCLSLQVPRRIFDVVRSRAKSSIITP